MLPSIKALQKCSTAALQHYKTAQLVVGFASPTRMRTTCEDFNKCFSFSTECVLCVCEKERERERVRVSIR